MSATPCIHCFSWHWWASNDFWLSFFMSITLVQRTWHGQTPTNHKIECILFNFSPMKMKKGNTNVQAVELWEVQPLKPAKQRAWYPTLWVAPILLPEILFHKCPMKQSLITLYGNWEFLKGNSIPWNTDLTCKKPADSKSRFLRNKSRWACRIPVLPGI